LCRKILAAVGEGGGRFEEKTGLMSTNSQHKKPLGL